MNRSFITMPNLEREVTSYVRGVVEDRLANDPNRLNAFWNVVAYFGSNSNCTGSARYAMIRQMFGSRHEDLALVFYSLLQDEYDDILLQSTPQVRADKLFKVAMMCLCIQFMDLFRQCFSVHEPFYTTLSNVVHQFNIDQVTESHLRLHLYHILNHYPAFRVELQARINRHTTLLNLWGGGSNGGTSNNPGGTGNSNPPPPQI